MIRLLFSLFLLRSFYESVVVVVMVELLCLWLDIFGRIDFAFVFFYFSHMLIIYLLKFDDQNFWHD